MITIATYTSSKITISIIQAVKQHGQSSLVLTVIKKHWICGSRHICFTLQRSMIAPFKEMEYGYIMDILTGAVIYLFVTILGVTMIMHGRKEGERNGKIKTCEDK